MVPRHVQSWTRRARCMMQTAQTTVRNVLAMGDARCPHYWYDLQARTECEFVVCAVFIAELRTALQ